jgi:hypothetical protein
MFGNKLEGNETKGDRDSVTIRRLGKLHNQELRNLQSSSKCINFTESRKKMRWVGQEGDDKCEQEVLGTTNRLLSLIRHGPHRKEASNNFSLQYRNVFNEPLPSNEMMTTFYRAVA